jgi:hypothetical protein
MATFETFVADNWVELPKGKELFDKAATSGVPIKVVHPNGNFKVIRNGDKLPKGELLTSTKATPKPKAETKTETETETKPKTTNTETETGIFIDPAMVGA